MSALTNFTSMKPEDLTLELFSLQLELDQVPFGGESQSRNNKLSSANMTAVTTSTTVSGPHNPQLGQHHMFDLNRFQHTEPMVIDPCNQDSFGFHANGGNCQKSSDEGTVIDDDIMDVIQQSFSDTFASQLSELCVKPEDCSPVSELYPLPLCIDITPSHSNATSPTGSYKGSHSSQGGGPPTPPDINGKKKKLKTRHARDSTHSQIVSAANATETSTTTFTTPYESKPTPATPTTTPISSCPSSPGGHSGYHSQGSTKSTSSRGKPAEIDKSKVPRHKRASHIKAEYKRRNKIQGGIEDLQKIVPTISDSGSKESKSAVLNKAVDYTRQLVSQTKEQRVEMERLRAEIEALRADIIAHQEVLPATGAKGTQINVAAQNKTDSMLSKKPALSCQQMFNDYVNSKSLSNWRFWIFGLLIRPLFDSYNSSVDSTSMETLSRSVMLWCKHHCSMVALRPAVFNFLRDLADRTSIRTKPEKLSDEVIQSVIAENFPVPSTDPGSNKSKGV